MGAEAHTDIWVLRFWGQGEDPVRRIRRTERPKAEPKEPIRTLSGINDCSLAKAEKTF